ncbi:HAMP domain-containing sensor histidine kinase [Chitinibacter sp. GC72]|uniref:sensor histidine kinase n=1 Tax=Chitinibacter sp. GC72 TaxID=1526917 RepID=UPI0012F8C005|nr:HAMP domain-containing sensor histidine kinase [Chitinibacter sp. GC72]
MDPVLARIDRISRDHPLLAFKLAVNFSEHAEQAGRVDLLLDACYIRYLIHERRGENDLIAAEVEAGIAQAKFLGLTAQGARLLQARGRIAQVHGRYQLAIEAWMQSLELAQISGDYVTAVEAQIGLSQANVELKNPDEGRRYLLGAADNVRQSGDDYLAAKYAINLGVNIIQFGLWEKALQHFREGLQYSLRGHVREYIAESYWHIGHVEMVLGELELAGQNLDKAIMMARKYHYLWLESVSLDSQAELYRVQQNRVGEIESLQAAYALAEKTNSLARQLEYAVDLVNAYEVQGNLIEALRWAHIERGLSAEHFKRSLVPVHRNMKALDLSEQDAQEQLLTLSFQDGNEDQSDMALPTLLARAKPLLNVDWIGLWFANPYHDGGELGVEEPACGRAAQLIEQAIFPTTYRLLNELTAPLPLSLTNLHESAEEFARLLGLPWPSLLFLPIRQAGRRGLLVLSSGTPEEYHNWTRDDVFRASLLQQLIERRLAAEERQQMKLELERGERVSALGSLVAAVAHELNTPAGICITTASIIEANLAALDQQFATGKLGKSVLATYLGQQREASQTLVRNLGRIVELIERFRDLPKQQSADHWQIVNLGHFIRGLVNELAQQFASRPIEIILKGDDVIETALPMIALAQIITQLFENAASHAFIGREQGRITLSWSRKAGYIQLNYQDDGVGMSAAMVKKIFDPFFTSRFGQGSNGLGMTRVYQLLVQQMYGSIRVDSEPGQGLNIYMSWPEPAHSVVAPH